MTTNLKGMERRTLSGLELATLKRVAGLMDALERRKASLQARIDAWQKTMQEKLNSMQAEMNAIDASMESWDGPIKAQFGYSVKDLMVKNRNAAGKMVWSLRSMDFLQQDVADAPQCALRDTDVPQEQELHLTPEALDVAEAPLPDQVPVRDSGFADAPQYTHRDTEDSNLDENDSGWDKVMDVLGDEEDGEEESEDAPSSDEPDDLFF